MSWDVVVVGTGPGGLRAAAAFAAAGRRVVLLEEGPYPAGLAHPDLPVGSGLSWRRGPMRTLATQVLGPALEPAEAAVGQALQLGDRRLSLPLRHRELFPLLERGRSGRWGTGLGTLGRARLAQRLPSLLNRWSEVRSYRDWIQLRFGEGVFETLYAGYCQRRWGPPEELAAAVAARFHGLAAVGTQLGSSWAPEERIQRQLALLESAGGSRQQLGGVPRLHMEGGRVVAVSDPSGARWGGQVVVERPPAWVAGALDETPEPTLLSDLRQLSCDHAVEVALRAEGWASLPHQLHLLDGSGPFFRVLRPDLMPGCQAQQGLLVLHARLPAADPLWRGPDHAITAQARVCLEGLGLGPRPGGAGRVNRLLFHQPRWTVQGRSAWFRVRRWMDRIGLLGVGRAGSFHYADPQEELALLEALLLDQVTTQGEAQRRCLEAPADTASAQASLKRWIRPC